MEIITDINTAQPFATVATIGSFDGVHRGHVAMIDEARSVASQRGLPLTVITFAQHPRLLFKRVDSPFLLTSFEEKMSLLAACSVDRCVLLPFDESIAMLSAYDFMEQVLRDRLRVSVLAVGYDHRFGHPSPGEGYDDYVQYGKEIGIEVVRMQPYLPGGNNVSSSAVRRALEAGDVATAETLLGRRYSVYGTVEHGAALGRSIGFPTANIALHEPMQMLPLDGVYECVVDVEEKSFLGVMNIGHKPTVGCNKRTIEVFIIDFDEDIYGSCVRVHFVRRLRGEVRFASLEELRWQIEKDVADAKEHFSKLTAF